MKVSELNPRPVDRIRFDDWQQRIASPQEPGCYVIASFDDDILYIGQSVDIGKRMESHLTDNRKRKLTPDGVAYWLYYTIRQEGSDLNALERGWVLEYRGREGKLPPFNKIMPPV